MSDVAAGRPGSATEALAAVTAGLSYLARADAASLGTAAQADCLRALEAAEAIQTAARANLLTAFHRARGYEADGSGSTHAWLIWQTKVTRGAARGAVGWMRRLRAHPAVCEALTTGTVSASSRRPHPAQPPTAQPGRLIGRPRPALSRAPVHRGRLRHARPPHRDGASGAAGRAGDTAAAGPATLTLKHFLDYRTHRPSYLSTCLTKWLTWTGCSRRWPIRADGGWLSG
jgi:hypothetical protein